jgi:hypothetical protein
MIVDPRQYIPEDNSEHHTRRRENLKSHILNTCFILFSGKLNYEIVDNVTYCNSGNVCVRFHSYAWLFALLHNSGDKLLMISGVTIVTGEILVDRWS